MQKDQIIKIAFVLLLSILVGTQNPNMGLGVALGGGVGVSLVDVFHRREDL